MPRLHVDDNPHLVSPGVKWGVRPGSFTHCTEFFGPVLGVMEARESRRRDRSGERDRLRPHLRPRKSRRPRAPHLAGANPRRQPLHQSPDDRRDRAPPTLRRHGQERVGPGIKAGGPNYVAPLMRFEDATVAPGSARGVGIHESNVIPTRRHHPAEPRATWIRPNNSTSPSHQRRSSLRTNRSPNDASNSTRCATRSPTSSARPVSSPTTNATQSRDGKLSRLDARRVRAHARPLPPHRRRQSRAATSPCRTSVRIAAEDTPWEIFARAAAAPPVAASS